MTGLDRRARLTAIALFAGIAAAATGPIRSYDLFWHLATGRWIVEHRALPATDPFAVASDPHPWINGEWLFQIAAYAAEAAGGLEALSWMRGLLAAALFTYVWLAARRTAEAHTALLLTALSAAGALPIFDMRPAGAAAAFVALSLTLRSRAGFAVLTVLWINVHPSALLAPAIAAVREAGTFWPVRTGEASGRRVPLFVWSALALLVNPHGVRAVSAPLELMAWVRSGAFVNLEWLPATPLSHPLLYAGIAIAAVAFATAHDRRAHWWRIVLLAMFAGLAVQHVRNQPLFFVALPLLAGPAVRRDRVPRVPAYAAAGLVVAVIAVAADHRLGVAPERFPLRAVARMRATGLSGNVYNPDQFGGVLIWSLYPERRTLTDGRNELYRVFIPEYARAREDERAWRALLARYRIDLAVDEYRAPLRVVNGVTGEVSLMPASLAYWPRSEWALIAWDEAAMVFARRKRWPAAVIERWEIRGVVPDARPVS